MEVLGAAPANRLPEDAELPPLEDDEDLPPLEEDVSAEEDEDLPPLEEDSDLEAPDLVDSDQERRAKAEAKAEEKRATAARMKGVAPARRKRMARMVLRRSSMRRMTGLLRLPMKRTRIPICGEFSASTLRKLLGRTKRWVKRMPFKPRM
jgi:hypothetical protein